MTTNIDGGGAFVSEAFLVKISDSQGKYSLLLISLPVYTYSLRYE